MDTLEESDHKPFTFSKTNNFQQFVRIELNLRKSEECFKKIQKNNRQKETK